MIQNVSFQLADASHAHIEPFDNTKLVAVNTCPTWGVVRYGHHLRMPGSGRAMALEAGSAMHEVFAWVRLYTLLHGHAHDTTAVCSIYHNHGIRIFGDARWKDIIQSIPISDDIIHKAKMGAFKVLETGSFYDDPSDKRRTLTNMEECCVAYIDKWDWKSRIWVRDINDDKSDVGIEINYNLLVTITKDDGDVLVTRHTGIIDGIHIHTMVNKDTIFIHENKTASRLNDAWSMAFNLSTQITGYCIAASTFTGEQINNAIIHGITIPLPRSYDYGGIIREFVTRREYHFTRWMDWYLDAVTTYKKYNSKILEAPQYTHSCSRYFRPCSLIPFCDSHDDDRHITLGQMVKEIWSPLETKSGE